MLLQPLLSDSCQFDQKKGRSIGVLKKHGLESELGYAPNWLTFSLPHRSIKYTPYSSNGTEMSLCLLYHQYMNSPAVGCVFLCIV
jgi:hypothetical protein